MDEFDQVRDYTEEPRKENNNENTINDISIDNESTESTESTRLDRYSPMALFDKFFPDANENLRSKFSSLIDDKKIDKGDAKKILEIMKRYTDLKEWFINRISNRRLEDIKAIISLSQENLEEFLKTGEIKNDSDHRYDDLNINFTELGNFKDQIITFLNGTKTRITKKNIKHLLSKYSDYKKDVLFLLYAGIGVNKVEDYVKVLMNMKSVISINIPGRQQDFEQLLKKLSPKTEVAIIEFFNNEIADSEKQVFLESLLKISHLHISYDKDCLRNFFDTYKINGAASAHVKYLRTKQTEAKNSVKDVINIFGSGSMLGPIGYNVGYNVGLMLTPGEYNSELIKNDISIDGNSENVENDEFENYFNNIQKDTAKEIKESINLLFSIYKEELYDSFEQYYIENVGTWLDREEEKVFIEYATTYKNIALEDIINIRIFHSFLHEYMQKGNMSDDMKTILQQQDVILENFFKNMNNRLEYARKKRQENMPEFRLRHRSRPRVRETERKNVSGDIKSLDPIDIVRGNDSIRKYVFGKKIEGENPLKVNLPQRPEQETIQNLKDRNEYQKLFSETIASKDFNEYRDFFDEDGKAKDLSIGAVINGILVTQDNIIDLQNSQKEILEDIESTILSNARKNQLLNYVDERRNAFRDAREDRIHEDTIRMSSIMCCIQAMQKLFQSNKYGENFAGQLEIKDVNNDIELSGEEGHRVLSMRGWINGKYTKIYYNLDEGTLSSDRFLKYNTNSTQYEIGSENSKEDLNTLQMPTLKELEEAGNKAINTSSGKSSIPGAVLDYAKTSTKLIKNAIRSSKFIGNGGVNLEVNQLVVSDFVRQNLLEQEIMTCIYGHFYDEKDIFKQELIVTGNQKEQFKMVDLIYKSVNYYHEDSEKLAMFRNSIAKLGNILNDVDKLRNCTLLDLLFLDSKQDTQDSFTQTHDILKRDNPNIAQKNGENLVTNNSNRMFSQQATLVHNTSQNENINFYTLLDMFVGRNSNHIDIEIFSEVIDKIADSDSKGKDPISLYMEEHKDNPNIFQINYYNQFGEQIDKNAADDMLKGLENL